MAKISGTTSEKVYSIPKWLGLNEHPDGDTRLKLGEASVMENWKITRDGNLKRRPGSVTIAGLMQNYRVDIKDTRYVTLQKYSADDVVSYYTSASAYGGRISLSGGDVSIEGGIVPEEENAISSGVWTPTNAADPAISGGILELTTAAEMATIADLETALAELDEGEYLYIWHEEKPYALNANCLTEEDGVYTLSGYRVFPKPIINTGTDLSPVWEDTEALPVAGMWTGLVGSQRMFLAACDGKLYNLYDEATDTFIRTEIDDIETDNSVFFFPFDNKVYILNGHEYYEYDGGSSIKPVDGYIPIVAMAIGPIVDGEDGAESGEITAYNVNRLNGHRRVWLSPDGENPNVFQMPEKSLLDPEVLGTWDYDVKDLLTGESWTYVPLASWESTADKNEKYTVDFEAGEFTLGTIDDPDNPGTSIEVPKGVNSFEVLYTVPGGFDPDTGEPYGYMALREQVTSQLYAEMYSGQTDTTIWLYGDGTNRTIYSGMDEYGQARADYFPDQYEARVGDANAPITALIRHYGDLVCYKTDSAWSLSYTLTSIPDTNDLMPAVYVTPVNKDKGNLAPGQVRLVDNNPVTLSGGEIYHWINSSYYSSNISRDERQARRISDRVQKSIKWLELPNCCMWDDNGNQEFYIGGISEEADGDTIHAVLVWNYATDTWYKYTGFDVRCFASLNGEVFFGTSSGDVKRITYDAKGDDGEPIEATWVSGAIDFGSDYMRKYSSMMWIGLKPEAGTSVDISVITDRKDTFRDKVVSSEKAKIPGEPFPTKAKIKAKKFTFYHLVLESAKDSIGHAILQPAVTVTNVDFRVRMTGYAK